MNEEDLKLLDMKYKAYELYVHRVIKENDLVWSRFKIYLSINAGAFAAIAIFIKEFASNLIGSPLWLWVILFFISIAGILISISWKAVNQDGVKWTLLINEHLVALEKELHCNNINLYQSIMNTYHSSSNSGDRDVTETNVKVAQYFIYLWITVSILSLIAAIYI